MVTTLKEGQMDSGLSLGERIMSAYWETEKAEGNEELKSPNYYKNKLSEIVDNVKSEIDQGNNIETIMDNFIYALVNSPENIEYRKEHMDIPLTKTLSSEKISCASSTSLYLILSEAIDFDLFEKYHVGDLLEHVLIKKKEGENYENIDEGERFNGNRHKYWNYMGEDLPETKQKENILSTILLNFCGI